ncbi:MAG: histidine kinase [Desulfobacterales bacterium]|nr:histidine kinase [Desulfobacterales bacterium]
MRIKYFSPRILTGLLILLIAMITGLLLSLIISFVFPDVALKFVSVALLNSFFLGLAMLLSLYLTRTLVSRLKNIYVIALSICLVFGIGIVTILMIFFMEPVIFIYYYEGTVSFLLINLLFILSLNTIVTGSVLYQDTVSAKERALAEEKVLKKEMEMKLLSTKVNPHFLFNSLNLIVSMLKKPEIAERALISLSELLRYNLDKSERDRVLLEEEIESVKKYLAIQKMRFDQRLEYEINCSVKGSIPPLIVQPLVENSIKYNIKEVDVLKIMIDVSRGKNKIVIKIIDSAKKVTPDMLHKGTGLTVTQKRVENAGGSFIIKNGGIEISF